MDPPPPHPTPTAAATTTQLNLPDSSANSSPRGGSRHNNNNNNAAVESWNNNNSNNDDPLPTVPGGGKLRLMCSYGGHIIPHPDSKSLCYVGGDTRIVVVDRHSATLSSLSLRLSRTLLHGRHFTLKYQLPTEDLDSLISVTTDEDLDNMIDEYDRTTVSDSSLKPSRLRLFLFPAKPETSTSMGSLLDDAKSETWFVDALNGSGLLPRGLSDSAAMDCLLELDSNSTDLEAQVESNKGLNSKSSGPVLQELNSTLMPDSPMVETNSSFGSSSSSPSMSNLPPIRVRVDDNAHVGGGGDGAHQMVGLDEQFLQMNVNAGPPLPASVSSGVSTTMGVSGGDANANRVNSDDERSDHGLTAVGTGLRKPPLPLQPVARKFGDVYNPPSPDSKVGGGGGFNFPSPDSVASDSSIVSASSLSKQAFHQDPTHVPARETQAPPTQIDPKPHTPDPTSQIQIQQVQDSFYPSLPPQQHHQQHHHHQQQFIHTNPHYLQHPQSGQMPVSSYYQMYTPQSQQQFHPQVDQQQYPVYLLPASQAQPNPTMVSSTHPITKIPAPNQSEMGSSTLYRTTGTASPNLVQVPSNQYQQQQYMGYTQMHHHHPSQSIANYGLEYGHPTQDQMYYTQHPGGGLPPPPQYQTMTSVAAVLLSQPPSAPATESTSPQPL